MKLIDEIKVLQEELNSIVNENSNDMSRLINLSEKLDKLIAQYYSETQNK
ncbi:aspartyl-phosphate phosphatase Spo0E family protein [Oxobacter pfennigii]|nr:aspartyl-phosphate phosphatase Spo0E family protein [Oxobacter pfennigii]